jgi:flagellar biosynthesis protein FliP
MKRRTITKWIVPVACAAALMLFAVPATAQSEPGPGDFEDINPIRALEQAAAILPQPPNAEGQTQAPLSSALNILGLLTVLTLAPAVLMLCTCFTRVVIVLSLLRQALGTQAVPPSQVIVGLSLFITFVVMGPTAQRMYQEGVGPYVRGEQTDHEIAWDRTKQPLREFMFAQLEATGNWSGLYMMLNYRGIDTSDPQALSRDDVDMLSLIPAYILSELKVSFLIGFRVYLPFLVIDMVISSMLISMGMLMLPPVLISLPFKLLLFVLVDGWQLIVGSLMNGVARPEMTAHAQILMSFAWT